MKVFPGIQFFQRHCSQEKLVSFRVADPSKIDDKHRKTMMHTWNTRALLRWEQEGGRVMWKTSNDLLHFGRAWGKILHNKSLCSVFHKKTPPISILNLTLKMGRENWRDGREKTHFFHRENNIPSICPTKGPSLLPQIQCLPYRNDCPTHFCQHAWQS